MSKTCILVKNSNFLIEGEKTNFVHKAEKLTEGLNK